MKWSLDSIRAIFRLPAEDRLLVGQSWLVLLLVRLALLLLPFPTVRAACEGTRRRRTNGGAHEEDQAQILRITRAVEIAARHSPFEPTCLLEALAVAWLLGRRGIASTLRIGVARRNDQLVAHAWLERHGQPIYGSSDPGLYAPLWPAGSEAPR